MRTEMVLSVFLLSMTWMTQVLGNSIIPNCLPGYKTEDTLAFSETPGDYAITCKMAYIQLSCCVQGYSSINWYRRKGEHWKELKLNPIMFYEPNDRNQTLTLQSPLPDDDEGEYMCVAEDDSGNHINNTFRLEIRECEAQNQAPIAILPKEDEIPRALGSNVIITCQGYFGVAHHNTYSDIYWQKTKANATGHITSDIWIPQNDVLLPTASNIMVTYQPSRAHIKSSVHISNITEDDFANYTCKYINTINSTSKTVELVEYTEQNKTSIIIQVVREDNQQWQKAVITIVVILGVVVILASVLYVIRLDLKLLYRDRFSKVLVDGKMYDALIAYNQNVTAERKFAYNDMINVLEKEYGYKLYVEERDGNGGDVAANEWLRRANVCRCIVFLLSPALLQEEWIHYLYVSTAKRHDIQRIFLVYRQVDDEQWQNHQEAFKTAFKVAKRKVWWPGNTNSPETSSLPTQTSSTSSSNKTRSELKFWKELRWALPKPLSLCQSQDNESSSNTTHPFSSQSSSSSQIPLTRSNGSPYAFEVI